MLVIYHNPRCAKSRQTLKLIEESGEPYKIILYLENPPTVKELGEIIDKLGIAPIDLVRKKEAIWKERYKGKKYTGKQIIALMVENPKLIERPIVVKGEQAVIGRPPENVLALL